MKGDPHMTTETKAPAVKGGVVAYLQVDGIDAWWKRPIDAGATAGR